MDDRNNSFSRDDLTLDAHVSSTYETTGSDVEIVPLAPPPSIPEYEHVVATAKSAPANDTHRDDDPLAIDASMADPSLYPIALEVLPEKHVRWPRIVTAAAAAAAIALGVGVLARDSEQPAARDTSASAAAIARAAARPVADSYAVTAASTSPDSPAPIATAAASGASEIAAPSSAPTATTTVRSRRVHSIATRSTHAAPAPIAPAVQPAETTVARSTAPEARADANATCRAACHADVNCLLRCFEPMSTRAATAPRPALSLAPPAPHDAPTQSEVANALAAINPALHECTGGATGRTTLTIHFANSGRPTLVNVGLPYAGTPVGSCIARAIRNVHIEPFTQSAFQASVTYRIP